MDRKKGARLKRGEDDILRQRGGGGGEVRVHDLETRGVTPGAPPSRAHMGPSRAGGKGGAVRRSAAELEEMDKMLVL